MEIWAEFVDVMVALMLIDFIFIRIGISYRDSL